VLGAKNALNDRITKVCRDVRWRNIRIP